MLLLYTVRKSQALDQVALSLDAWEQLQVRPDNRQRTSIMSVGIKNASQLIVQNLMQTPRIENEAGTRLIT